MTRIRATQDPNSEHGACRRITRALKGACNATARAIFGIRILVFTDTRDLLLIKPVFSIDVINSDSVTSDPTPLPIARFKHTYDGNRN